MSGEATRLAKRMTAVGVAVALVSLTACANPIEAVVQKGAERGVEKLIEQGTGSSIDIDTESGSITLGDENTSIDFGSDASLPEGWPDIPTPEGSIVVSTTTDEGMQIMVQTTTSEVQRVMDELKRGGFASTSSVDLGGIKHESFESDRYRVIIQAYPGDEGDTTVMQMIVGDRQE